MRAQESAKEPSKSAVFGSSGHGLDHVGVAVRDLETAKKDYCSDSPCSQAENIRTGREIAALH